MAVDNCERPTDSFVRDSRAVRVRWQSGEHLSSGQCLIAVHPVNGTYTHKKKLPNMKKAYKLKNEEEEDENEEEEERSERQSNRSNSISIIDTRN